MYSTYFVSAHFKAYEHGIDFDDITETQFEILWDLLRYSKREKQKMLPCQESAFLQYCMDDSLAHSDVSIQIFKI